MQAPQVALLEDDGEALDAVLAYLNDWPSECGDASGTSHETGSSTDDNDASSATDDPAIASILAVEALEASQSQPGRAAAPPPRNRGKSTIDRRKDELKQLQAEATKLEAVLRAMTLQKNGIESTALSQSVSPPNPDRSGSTEEVQSVWMTPETPVVSQRAVTASLWKDMALRHKKLRKASETENGKLRHLVDRQRKTVMSIRSIIRRQMQYDRHNQPAIVSVRAISSSVPSDDSHILEQLRLDVERHSMSALTSLRGWSVLRPGSQIRQASATKISIVSSERQLMPFHSSDITSALWRSVGETCVKHNRFYQQRVAEKDGTLLMRGHCIENDAIKQDFKIRGKTAVRRTNDDRQDGFVFAGVSRTVEVSGEQVSGISIREHSVMSIVDVDGEKALSQLTALHQFEIEFDPTDADESRHAETLANILTANHPGYFRDMLLDIEGVVLQQQA